MSAWIAYFAKLSRNANLHRIHLSQACSGAMQGSLFWRQQVHGSPRRFATDGTAACECGAGPPAHRNVEGHICRALCGGGGRAIWKRGGFGCARSDGAQCGAALGPCVTVLASLMQCPNESQKCVNACLGLHGVRVTLQPRGHGACRSLVSRCGACRYSTMSEIRFKSNIRGRHRCSASVTIAPGDPGKVVFLGPQDMLR